MLGLADVVVLNDPITGQGSNNASKCAASYLATILDHGEHPYDAAFMELAFGRFWDNAQSATTWTNAMLGAPPQHVLEIFGAASANPVSPPASSTALTTHATCTTGSWTRSPRRTT